MFKNYLYKFNILFSYTIWFGYIKNIFKSQILRAETEKGLSRKHIIEGVKASLERLQLDYIDIVFANKPDVNTPMEGDYIFEM